MGNVGLHDLRPLVLRLAQDFKINTFVETGTYKGETTFWASEHFDTVITIEAHEPRYKKTLAAYSDIPNIDFVFGNSGELLGDHLPGDQPAVAWLDAHWCGNYEKPVGTWGECPIIQEIEQLNNADVNHFVLIDDARLFTSHPPRPHDPEQWPSFFEIMDMLKAKHEKHIEIWNDCIIAVPPDARSAVEEVTGQ